MAAVTWEPLPVVVYCHGEITPQRDEEWGKTRYRCPECLLDLQVSDDLIGTLFAPVIDNQIADVPLPMLIGALNRLRP